MTNENGNLFAHFRSTFDGRENSELLVTEDERSYSFSDFDTESARIASYLTSLGVQIGDRVSVQVQKSPENLCLYLACLRAGFVFHPLNPGYKKTELEYFIGDAEPTAIVCDSECRTDLDEIAADAKVSHVLTLNSDGSGTLMESCKHANVDYPTCHRNKDDLAALLYSSGTTGVPKGIMLTHGNLSSNAHTLVKAWGFTDNDRLLHALPIFHVHGLFVGIGCVLMSGASMRWLQSFDARKIVDYLPECSVMMGVPTYYTRLLAESAFTTEVSESMRLFVSGSAPLLEETFIEFEARTGHRILERYGMTETNMNTSNPLTGERKPGTVGPPLAGVDTRIKNDNGEILGAGEIGNLHVRGPNVFAGYWRLPEKTAADFTDDGFFNTGDLGKVDDEGYVSIVGRARDLVITGGLNVYPKEIELFIDELPGVRESAVIGVPHADFGEGIVAIVVPRDAARVSEDSVMIACRDSLANFKVPKKVIIVDKLPRNAMAKVQKNVLRDTYHNCLA